MGEKKRNACTFCLGVTFPMCFIIGLALIAGGIALYSEYPSFITRQVNKKATVEKGHATYEQLEEPSIPIFKDFYFFNFTNCQEFQDQKGGAIPNFTEIGPYSFRELRTKVLREITTNRSEVNYTQRKIFHFSEDTSGENLKDSDTICTINIPLIGAIATTKNSSALRRTLKLLIGTTGAKLYVCKKATDLVWGYTDSFIQAISALGLYPQNYISIQTNDSSDDAKPSIINTGMPDITQVGQFIRWNGRRELGIWQEGSEANEIRGTEGLFFKPNLQEGEKLTAFVDDVVRSFDLQFEGRVDRLGLTAFRYGIDNSTFKSAFNEPKNAQYFSWCPDGMFYLGPTQVVEVPVFGSKPHFLDGDPLLLESVRGLNPNRAEHDTVIDVEPTTGANVNFQRKLQVVVQVNKTEKHGILDTIHIAENVMGYNESLYFPVLFLNEHATMDNDFKTYLEGKGLKLIGAVEIAAPVVFALFVILGAVSVVVGFLTMFAWIKRNKRMPRGEKTMLLQKEDTE